MDVDELYERCGYKITIQLFEDKTKLKLKEVP